MFSISGQVLGFEVYGSLSRVDRLEFKGLELRVMRFEVYDYPKP